MGGLFLYPTRVPAGAKTRHHDMKVRPQGLSGLEFGGVRLDFGAFGFSGNAQ